MRSWNDKVKPGRGIDDNKGVGFQTQGNDVKANKRIYGGSLPDTSAVTGGEAK